MTAPAPVTRRSHRAAHAADSRASPRAAAHRRARISRWWWAASGGGILLLLLVLIVVAGGVLSPAGRPWLAEPDKIILALIPAVPLMLAPVIPTLRNISKDTAATTHHVVNSHGDRVLRDDLDRVLYKLDALTSTVGDVRDTQRSQGRDILGLREEIGQIRKTERDQWAAIEETAGRRRQHLEGTS